MPGAKSPSIAIVGGGPAGLMAAEAVLERTGPGTVEVRLYDAMPSVGRKFLLAGRGGLNLTHAEPREPFLQRYAARRAALAPYVDAFGADALRAWAQELGIATFVGSSGRVFPVDMKTSPLLRAWLRRLAAAGLMIHPRHRWRGWSNGTLRFDTPQGERVVQANAVVLALGGASWARLGSDGGWVHLLAERGVPVAPLRPSNCGFDARWSAHFRDRFAGAAVKTVVASCSDGSGRAQRAQGDIVVTGTGIEGGPVYTLSAALRDRIYAERVATLHLDIAPGWELERLVTELAHARGRRSLSSHIQSRTGLKGVKLGLLREIVPPHELADPALLAAAIKSLPLRLYAPRPLDEAISTAGGVVFEALDANLMIESMPGVFCAGEMLDWEAPTGGYLLTACFATGRAAGLGALRWVKDRGPHRQDAETTGEDKHGTARN